MGDNGKEGRRDTGQAQHRTEKSQTEEEGKTGERRRELERKCDFYRTMARSNISPITPKRQHERQREMVIRYLSHFILWKHSNAIGNAYDFACSSAVSFFFFLVVVPLFVYFHILK